MMGTWALLTEADFGLLAQRYSGSQSFRIVPTPSPLLED
jgi:hypothetical protein